MAKAQLRNLCILSFLIAVITSVGCGTRTGIPQDTSGRDSVPTPLDTLTSIFFVPGEGQFEEEADLEVRFCFGGVSYRSTKDSLSPSVTIRHWPNGTSFSISPIQKTSILENDDELHAGTYEYLRFGLTHFCGEAIFIRNEFGEISISNNIEGKFLTFDFSKKPVTIAEGQNVIDVSVAELLNYLSKAKTENDVFAAIAENYKQ